MANILVTGGAGYIGSHTAKALHRAGWTPVVVDSLENGHDWAVKWGPLIHADIADREAVRDALDEYQPQGVIHFAAFIEAGESVRNPLSFWLNNVAKTAVFLDELRAFGSVPLVFSSTAAVYAPSDSPLGEDAPLGPANPYGRTKLAVEEMLADLVAARGGAVAALRYFNACGADAEGELGEAHDPETHLIPILIEVLRGQRGKAQIFGEDYPTPDGTCVRDYIHVEDLARAHVMTLDWLRANPGFHRFNVGTGAGHSVRAVVEAVKRVGACDFDVAPAPRRAGDAASLVADPSRIEQAMGFRAEKAGLDDMVGSALRWAQRGGGR